MKRQEKNNVLEKAVQYWAYVAPLVCMPKNEKEFDMLVSRLDQLLDIVGENEKHPAMTLVDIMSDNIAVYEDKKYKKKLCKGVNALKFLMKEHKLKQSDLPELGSQGVVSEILNGKRSLNVRQIKLLAKRFHVDPETFM